MTSNTTLSGDIDALSASTRTGIPARHLFRLRLLTWLVVFAVFIIALLMRLHTLGAPFDRDSYDEGVYWQSLQAMSAGHVLYRDIFYSQTPFFLLSVYPFYALLGHTIWAARLGVAVLSLGGFLGALLLGKTLAGRPGMIIALVLLLSDPLYLSESQTLQAEMPSVSLSLLAVGLAFLWWERPTGRRGICLAVLSTITLALSILAKLLTISVLVPIGLLALAHIWRTARQPAETRRAYLLPLLTGVTAFILTFALVLLPFVGSFSQLWQMTVSFHTDAIAQHLQDASQARVIFKSALNPFSPGTTSLGNSNSILLPITALLGTVVALWRRDWRVLPLLAWLLATLAYLWQLAPLFPHHLVALIPPYLALTLLGLSPLYARPFATRPRLAFLKYLPAVLTCLLIACIFTSNVLSIRQYYDTVIATAESNSTRINIEISQNMREQLKPGQLVITDGLFVADLADASTPPALVDLSTVRILSGYVTTPQLIHEAAQPAVQLILYDTGRLNQLPDFYQWVKQHYHLIRTYGAGKELWSKNWALYPLG